MLLQRFDSLGVREGWILQVGAVRVILARHVTITQAFP